MDADQSVLNQVWRIIEAGRTCENSFTTAADVAETEVARKRFQERSAVWHRFCNVLQTAIGGAEAPRSLGMTGVLNRAWIKIKAAIGDADAIASECLEREAIALRYCRIALSAPLPSEIHRIIQCFCDDPLRLHAGRASPRRSRTTRSRNVSLSRASAHGESSRHGPF